MSILFLLAFPVGLMGAVQLCFGLLSLLLLRDGVSAEFLSPASWMLVFSAGCLYFGRANLDQLARTGVRTSLVFATATWVIMGFLGAFPIAAVTGVSFTDSVFESISGLTTTGATILTGLDDMPRSFLMYRQLLQWLGGLGVVIFVVAVLPLLNIGGTKLLKAETPGPIKDEKISPRVMRTAHYLWFVYVALTVLCAAAYFLGGMSAFDAIAHSFTTLSTGGFSTHDASMGFFQSQTLLAIADVFMVLGAISFALHFRIWRSLQPAMYLRDEETRTFFLLVFTLSMIIFLILYFSSVYTDPLQAAGDAAFHLISFITSTGYGAAGFTEWSNDVAFLLVFASYLGGCAGSTAGGNKIIRNILTVKLVNLELKRLVHPRGVFAVKFQGRPVEKSVIDSTFAFMCLAAATSMGFTLLLMATGLDFWSAYTATAACINVLGPAFGELGSNFIPVSDAGTWLLSLAMVLGRLEYFTLLALVLPAFWQK